MHSPDHSGQLLLTLVDHAKPFKGTWQIFRRSESGYAACHSPSPFPAFPGGDGEPPCCQMFTSSQQICRFTETLHFYGWAIDGSQSPEALEFRLQCAL